MMFQTENVTGYAEPGDDGRDPANAGKFHVHLELLFDTKDEALRWMERNAIPIAAFEQER